MELTLQNFHYKLLKRVQELRYSSCLRSDTWWVLSTFLVGLGSFTIVYCGKHLQSDVFGCLVLWVLAVEVFFELMSTLHLLCRHFLSDVKATTFCESWKFYVGLGGLGKG